MAAGNFAAAMRRMLAHEGGYANHPNDPGGPTMKGVTQKVYDAYRDKVGAARQSVRHISDAELQAIYRKQYGDAIKFDQLPAGVDYCVFDGAVNSGPSQAIRWLQRGLGGVNVDGQLGLVTVEKVGAADPAKLINAMCDDRMAFLRRLRTWSTFGTGWTLRVAEVRRAALAMAAGTKAPKQTKLAAEATGKALPSDIKVTETPEGKSGTEQVTGTGSGGIAAWLMANFDTVVDYAGRLSGLPDSIMRPVIGGVIIVAAIVAVGLLARAAYGLFRIWRDKRNAETERADDVGRSEWRERVMPIVKQAARVRPPRQRAA